MSGGLQGRIAELERELENMRCRETLLVSDHAECAGLRVCWYEELTASGKSQDQAVAHISAALRRYDDCFGSEPQPSGTKASAGPRPKSPQIIALEAHALYDWCAAQESARLGEKARLIDGGDFNGEAVTNDADWRIRNEAHLKAAIEREEQSHAQRPTQSIAHLSPSGTGL